MAYKFMGENVPELKRFPKEQRRAMFLCATRKSYRHFSTWAGLCLFGALAYCGAEYSCQINESLRGFFASTRRSEMVLSTGICWAGLGALYYLQMKAIRAELLKMIESQRDAANHQSPSAPVVGGR